MKRSKILCVGMTAALSFALILAGCDGDGGSKNNGSTPTGGGKVSPVFQVEDGHNALKITGAAGASGFFKDGLHVYIKADGKEALITAAGTAPSGDYHAPSTTPVFIADTTGGAPALWVKNLDAAATPAANGKLLSGVNQITVNIAPDALENDVGDLGAVDSGTAVVVSANAGAAYKISASPPIAGEIKFDAGAAPNTVEYFPTGGASSGALALDTVFDAQLIAVLGGSNGLEATDEAAFNDKGVITKVSLLALSPSADKINGILANVGDLTLGTAATIGAGDKVTVPDNKTLALGDSIAITLDDTSSIEVGSTPAGAFKIAGASGGATLTASQTVSLMGLAGGSKISGSAGATLAVSGADGIIEIPGAATAGGFIESVTVDLSVNGIIKIEENGLLTLQGADAVILVNAANTTPMTGDIGIKDANIGSAIALKASAATGTGVELGEIKGADANNTIKAASATPVEIKKSVTNN